MIQPRKSNILMKIMNSSLIDLPSPSNISLMWNFGSLLGLCLLIQIFTGLLLSIHYSANTFLAFNSLSHICKDVNFGWLMRLLHANGASLFFMCLYSHIARGIFFSSFLMLLTWISGTMIFLFSMIIAFLGYILPWGQMSFWGATVISNLISVMPYLGNQVMFLIWGGFAIDNPTIMRFYSFHFILPFSLILLIIIHLTFLHSNGSSNPLGSNSNIDKIPFHPYFSLKDLMSMIIMIFLITLFTLLFPYLFMDPENFIQANPMLTPIHIQPEWYFLFAYAILRSIPNKLGGVIALIMSIFIITLLPIFRNQNITKSWLNNILFWYFINIFILLMWIGSQPVEPPFIIWSQILSFLYFLYFLFNL